MADEQTNAEDVLLEENSVKLWTKRVKDAKKYFEPDFKRMTESMNFAAGIQWDAQTGLDSTQYIANFVNREVNQKVATLYAKDPKAVFKRRQRLDYQLWDGSVESMQQAHAVVMQAGQAAQQNPAVMNDPKVIAAQALIADITHGKAWKAVVERVGRTLEVLYHYQCDTQTPDFKYQMKQLVRRTVTTGVGFVRLNYSREMQHALTASGTDDTLSMRVKRAKQIMDSIDDDKITEDDPRVQQLEQLMASVKSSVANGDTTNIEERLEFDFPSATSIIVDPKCKSLKGFIGARWVAQQFIIPLDEANAYFQTDIKAGGKLAVYNEDGIEKMKSSPANPNDKDDPQEKPLICLWEIFDITTKSSLFIADGWSKWVQAPAPVEPSINRFWPIFSLTFNDVEVEPGGKVHIYPPSDVDLIRHPQKEWNRTREELRKHRKSNRPWYLTVEGWLTEPDMDAINDHESNQLVRVKGLPPGGRLQDAIFPFHAAPIDQALYQTQPLLEDTSLVIGTNTAQSMQPQRHVAATPAVIQEQARISGVNSNVDDLDDLLSELARAGGEIMLREFALATVKRIAGQGAVWPEQNREDFMNEIFLDVVAASSGRPNKAVDVSNWQQIGPLMLQAGANPWALIRQYVKVLDANLEAEDFAPEQMPQAPQQPQAGKRPAPQHPGLVGQQPSGIRPPMPH
jgi:hypothetical protein